MTDLELGLYLVVQTQAAEGYEPVDPFLISLPMQEEGVYVYEVNATPKMSELVEAAEETAEETTAQTAQTPTSGATLPQTGQLNWPIPVLVALGLGLFSLGWVLRYGKKTGHEK